MSKTPDTDANVWSDSCEGILCKVVSAEFARRLERERDEAMELLASEKITRNHIIKRSVEVERERDEARDDAQKSKAYKRVLKETNLRQTERIRYLEGATNHACGTPLSVALKERDEAREEVKLLKAILDLIKKDVS